MQSLKVFCKEVTLFNVVGSITDFKFVQLWNVELMLFIPVAFKGITIDSNLKQLVKVFTNDTKFGAEVGITTLYKLGQPENVPDIELNVIVDGSFT